MKPGGVFVDLGSGSGKGILAAALTHNFDKCVGIEILDSLAKLSYSLIKHYEEHFKSVTVSKLQVFVGDFFKDKFIEEMQNSQTEVENKKSVDFLENFINWSLDKKFSPKMKKKSRNLLLYGWSRAIKRALINLLGSAPAFSHNVMASATAPIVTPTTI